MKYDIAQNEEGPLRKTVSAKRDESVEKGEVRISTDVPTAKRHPEIDGRIHNLEEHLAIRYGVFTFVSISKDWL
jgi:hypothetical protein